MTEPNRLRQRESEDPSLSSPLLSFSATFLQHKKGKIEVCPVPACLLYNLILYALELVENGGKTRSTPFRSAPLRGSEPIAFERSDFPTHGELLRPTEFTWKSRDERRRPLRGETSVELEAASRPSPQLLELDAYLLLDLIECSEIKTLCNSPFIFLKERKKGTIKRQTFAVASPSLSPGPLVRTLHTPLSKA